MIDRLTDQEKAELLMTNMYKKLAEDIISCKFKWDIIFYIRKMNETLEDFIEIERMDNDKLKKIIKFLEKRWGYGDIDIKDFDFDSRHS